MARYSHIALRNSHVSEPTPVAWKAIEAVSAEALQRFFRNVKYILQERGLTIVKMKDDIYSRYGYRIGVNAVNNYMKGVYTRSNTDYMGVICLYLKEDYLRMQSVEYSQEQHMAKQRTKAA